MISFRTRSAICFSRGLSSSSARNAAHSRIGRWQTAEMLWPPSRTASDSGLSRAPWQTGHGTSRMYPSYRSRLHSDSVSACRRWTNGTAPSNPVVYDRSRP